MSWCVLEVIVQALSVANLVAIGPSRSRFVGWRSHSN